MKKLWSGTIKHKATLNISQPFNCYFVNVPQQFDKAVPGTKKSSSDYLKDRNRNSIFTDSLETETIIMSSDNSKSVGPYSIPIRLLKTLGKPVSKGCHG